MASVDIEGVTKRFGAVEVLKGVDVTVPDGSFTVLVGPSGCGKSTLLRAVAGLEGVSTGRIRIGERVVNGLTPKARNIAMVFQNYALYPHMRVRENMAFSLMLGGVPTDSLEDRVKRAARTLGLSNLLERLPRQLSGGQRQRVAMGRAIVRDPSVFLFDEPLSNLDAKLRVVMRAEIKALHQRLATTSIYVTHDQVEAMTLADQVVVMRDGRIEQIGPPLEVYDRPSSPFVAGFIGSPSMNLLPGSWTSGHPCCVHLPGEGTVELLTQDHPKDARPGAVTIGIRPEHLELSDTGMQARVMVVEPTGSQTWVSARAGDHTVNAVLAGRQTLSPGDRVHLRPQPGSGRIHLFDPALDRRLN